ILYMAFTLWRAKPADPKVRQIAKPFTFLQAVMFQWVNPKVWAVSLAAAAGFGAGGTLLVEALRLSSAFSGINLLVCLFWAAAGTALARLLTTPSAWNIFRKTMASALALTAAMVFM
ncbi:MAG: LysE family translocator, partial [Proteobacteria bacterium]|nr:LysE family translocator [Pseudomonadota bacterium]